MRTRTQRENHQTGGVHAFGSSAEVATVDRALRDPLLDAMLAALRACPVEQAREVARLLSEHASTAFEGHHTRLLDVARAAQHLGKHPKTIERWCREGRLDGVQKVGATWRVPTDALDRIGLPETPRVMPGPPRRRNRQGTEQRRGSLLTAARKDKPGSREIAGVNVHGPGGPKSVNLKRCTDTTPAVALTGGQA